MQEITIIGAGITGLSIAYTLITSSPHTYRITILARDHPGDMNLHWASPWAGAVFHPQKTDSVVLRKMQEDSYKAYEKLFQEDTKNETGIGVYAMREYFSKNNEHTEAQSEWYKSFLPNYRPLPPNELPLHAASGITYTSLTINPLIFLPYLQTLLIEKGISFLRYEVGSIKEAQQITGAEIIVNASGLGSRELASDLNVHAIKGQTLFVNSSFEECIMYESASEYTYVIPRAGSGGVVLGGVKLVRGDERVDEGVREDILGRVGRIDRGVVEGVGDDVRDIIGFRPGRTGGMRVERDGEVVHAYGAGGAGYIYSFGVAEKIKVIIGEMVGCQG